MIETNNSIELNLKEDYNYKYLYAKQYDKKSRYVTAKIYDGEQLLTISPEDTIVRIRCTKPDKTYVLYDVDQANIKNNTIRFELTEQMLAKEGTVRCDIGLYTTLVNKEALVKEGESLISTAVFYINVEKAGYSEDAICSSSEFSALINALIKVEEAAKITEEAKLATEIFLAAYRRPY